METGNDLPPSEKTTVPDLQQEVADALGRSISELEFRNLDEYLKGGRFLIGFTPQTKEKSAGFFKISTDTILQPDPEVVSKSKEQISREGARTRFAQAIHVPCVSILTDCKETTSGKTILELEQLNSENGTFIPTELVETTDPAYGRRVAMALTAVSGKVIPSNVSTNGVDNSDERNKSLESFLTVWHESDKIFEPEYTDIVSRVIDPAELKKIADAELSELTEEIPKYLRPDTKYFVHNDVAPDNVFFLDATAENEAKTLFLDFEWAGFTNNRFLAQLTDYGNFYAKSWANKDMQQAFIQGVMEAPTQDSIEYRYRLARSSIIFGTVYLTKYGIGPNRKEHQMALKILGDLKENLAFLDIVYKTQQTNSHQLSSTNH